MNDSFAENFKDCCLDSMYRMADREENRREYQAISRECDELYEKIKERLGQDKELIFHFDEAKSREVSAGNRHIYHQGFRDCVYLLRWIGIL